MKIDIRDDTKRDKINKIEFSDRVDYMQLNENTINIPCAVRTSETAETYYEDIPNLIKALQRVCELRGIK